MEAMRERCSRWCLRGAPSVRVRGCIRRTFSIAGSCASALRVDAGPAGPGTVVALPLPEPGDVRASASAASELDRDRPREARSGVLVGARSARRPAGCGARSQVARRPARVLYDDCRGRRDGAVRWPWPARWGRTRAWRTSSATPEIRIAADPFDAPDPAHGNVKFTWFFDDVRAGEAVAAAGGGSSRTVAVLDTGLDTSHPELAGRVERVYDTQAGGTDVTDLVGHGTFVSGLIAAIDGNGLGGKGVAGNTRILAIRASRDGGFTERDLLRGTEFAIGHGADVLNLSLAGNGIDASVRGRSGPPSCNDVLPVAASPAARDSQNPVQFPAAVLGGERGAPGIGLSVGATRRTARWRSFDPQRLRQPRRPRRERKRSPLRPLDAARGGIAAWDSIDSCSRCSLPRRRPLRLRPRHELRGADRLRDRRAGLAGGAPARASEQVAEVLIRSARQTLGTGWNEFTGAGIVDGKAAATALRLYDVPRPGKAARGAAADV